MRRPRAHWRVIELSSFSAMFSQLPCFGVWQNSMRRTNSRGSGRLEHLVEGSLGVRVEVVAHQGDLLAVGVASFQQAGDLQRPVHLRTPRPNRRLPPTRQRFAEQEDRGRAGPFVLVVDTPRTVLRGRHRRAGFLDQPHRLLVHAHDGTLRIVGFLIQVQDLFHARHELGIGLRRDHPVVCVISTQSGCRRSAAGVERIRSAAAGVGRHCTPRDDAGGRATSAGEDRQALKAARDARQTGQQAISATASIIERLSRSILPQRPCP